MACIVTGVGIVAAPGVGAHAFVQRIHSGGPCISDASRYLDTTLALPVGEVPMSNTELAEYASLPAGLHLPRTALLGIIAVREAMQDAGIPAGKRVALVSATTVGGMDRTEQFFPAFMQDESQGRLRDVRYHDAGAIGELIARHCGIHGYRACISTACSSAANAILLGERLLRHSLADCVVAGGTDALSLFTLNGFNSLKILDAGRCRPMDDTRSGLNLGEGAGFVVLEREESGRDAYCRLTGCANSNDAHHQTASSEEGEGAYLAMSQALERASLRPTGVDYINVHGTGTQNNDLSESRALLRLFGTSLPPLSSTKGFTGHTLAAAGGVEAVLSALSVRHGILWPNAGFATPMMETGLVPQLEFREGARVDCVLSNSFGFGGNCSSLVFQKR